MAKYSWSSRKVKTSGRARVVSSGKSSGSSSKSSGSSSSSSSGGSSSSSGGSSSSSQGSKVTIKGKTYTVIGNVKQTATQAKQAALSNQPGGSSSTFISKDSSKPYYNQEVKVVNGQITPVKTMSASEAKFRQDLTDSLEKKRDVQRQVQRQVESDLALSKSKTIPLPSSSTPKSSSSFANQLLMSNIGLGSKPSVPVSSLTPSQKVSYGLIQPGVNMPKGYKWTTPSGKKVQWDGKSVTTASTGFQRDTARAVKVQDWAAKESGFYKKWIKPGTVVDVKSTGNNIYKINGQKVDYSERFKQFPNLSEQSKLEIVNKEFRQSLPTDTKYASSRWTYSQLSKMFVSMPRDMAKGVVVAGSNMIWALKGAYAPDLKDAQNFSKEALTAAKKVPGALKNQFLDPKNPQTYLNWAFVGMRTGYKGNAAMSRQALYKQVVGKPPTKAQMTIKGNQINKILKSELTKGVSNLKNAKTSVKITKQSPTKSKITITGTFKWGKMKVPFKQVTTKLTSKINKNDFKLNGNINYKLPKFNLLGKKVGTKTKSFSVKGDGSEISIDGGEGLGKVRDARIKAQIRKDLARGKPTIKESAKVNSDGISINTGSFRIKSLREIPFTKGKKFTFQLRGTKGKYTSIQKGNKVTTQVNTAKAIQYIKTELSNFVKNKKVTKFNADSTIKVVGTKVAKRQFQNFRYQLVKTIKTTGKQLSKKSMRDKYNLAKTKLKQFDNSVGKSKIMTKADKAMIKIAKYIKSKDKLGKRASLGDSTGRTGGRGDYGNFGDVTSRFDKGSRISSGKSKISNGNKVLNRLDNQIKALRSSQPRLKLKVLKESIKPQNTKMNLDFIWQQGALQLLQTNLTLIPPLLPSLNTNGLITNIKPLNSILGQVGIEPIPQNEAQTNFGPDVGPDVGPDIGPDVGPDVDVPVDVVPNIKVPNITTPSDPIINYFFPPSIPPFLAPGMIPMPLIFPGGSGGPASGYPSWLQQLMANNRYSPDLASRLNRVKAKSQAQVENLLRAGRVFSGLERRPLA